MSGVLRLMTAALVLLALAMTIVPRHSRTLLLHYNLTGSLPRGLYRAVVRDTVGRGEILHSCVPERAAPQALARGYLGRGSCTGRTAPVGKMVVGIAGDTVQVGNDSIRVGRSMVIWAPTAKRDTRGRPIENAAGTHILRASECFVLSTYSRRSYDSRYYGPIACEPPLVVLRPISARSRQQLEGLRNMLNVDE